MVADDILSVEEAAELLRLTPPTVRQMASRNLLPGRKLGGKYWRFSTRQLFAFIRCESLEPELPAPQSSQERRRRAVRQATPRWADMSAIAEIYGRCRYVTGETGVTHHVDHVIPLQHPKVCGLHVEYNLRITTAGENLKKHNRWHDC